MAGDWIKMGKDLLTHPKVVRMSSALRADKLRTVGGLFAVWCLFDTHSVDGQLSGYSAATIDDEIRFPGFCAAMAQVGWISFDGEGAVLPDFDEHNGQSAKRRAQETERKRNDRKSSASDADKKRTREEKRREEVIPTPTTRAPSADNEVFAIDADWAPGPGFTAQAKMAGLPVNNDVEMTEGLNEFRGYWMARPHELRTQAEWDNALAKSLKTRQVRGASRPAFQPSRPAAPRTPNHGGHDVVEPA